VSSEVLSLLPKKSIFCRLIPRLLERLPEVSACLHNILDGLAERFGQSCRWETTHTLTYNKMIGSEGRWRSQWRTRPAHNGRGARRCRGRECQRAGAAEHMQALLANISSAFCRWAWHSIAHGRMSGLAASSMSDSGGALLDPSVK
jgi:hypothetical protein